MALPGASSAAQYEARLVSARRCRALRSAASLAECDYPFESFMSHLGKCSLSPAVLEAGKKRCNA
jgi:hypothetical protein